MIYSPFLKNLPAPVRLLIRPMWWLSLGVHGLLLMIPMPSEEKPETPVEKKLVKIAQLPLPPSPQPSPIIQLPTPSPPVRQPTSLPVKPTSRIQPSPPLIVQPSPKIQLPKPSPIVAQDAPSPAPPSPTPVLSLTPAPSSAPPRPVASPSPIPSPTPTPSPTLTPLPTPTPSPTPTDPFADFQHFPNAQQGCNGVESCWQTAETQWAVVSNDLKQKLEEGGYVMTPMDIEDDIGRRAYEVSKEGNTRYYLNLISTGSGIVYLLTEQLPTSEQIRSAAKL
ncbi:MAG TPA: hypothetical protein V6C85_17505 [Allocoleopsis sp.]